MTRAAKMRQKVFTACREWTSVKTCDIPGATRSEVARAFHQLAKRSFITLATEPDKNPHGYQLVASIHPYQRVFRL